MFKHLLGVSLSPLSVILAGRYKKEKYLIVQNVCPKHYTSKQIKQKGTKFGRFESRQALETLVTFRLVQVLYKVNYAT